MAPVAVTMGGHPYGFQYRQCPDCCAPLVLPTPADMVFDLLKEGEAHGPVTAFVTPHLGGCPAELVQPRPGTAIRLTAANVSFTHLLAA